MAAGRHLAFLQTVRDSHLVQIRVSGKRQQTGVLVLPSEAPDPVGSFALGDKHLDRLAADLPVRSFALFLAKSNQGLVGDGFNITVPERIGGEPSSAYRLCRGYALLNLGADGAVIHEVPI